MNKRIVDQMEKWGFRNMILDDAAYDAIGITEWTALGYSYQSIRKDHPIFSAVNQIEKERKMTVFHIVKVGANYCCLCVPNRTKDFSAGAAGSWESDAVLVNEKFQAEDGVRHALVHMIHGYPIPFLEVLKA